MSNLTDFFPSGGGGGLTPKFQEFNASGTFTPTQALIDAGGYIEVFLVAGGGGAPNYAGDYSGGCGGEVITKKMNLTNVSNCTILIGSGGDIGNNYNSNPGGNSTFQASSAGGYNITSTGGLGGGFARDGNTAKLKSLSPNWGAFAGAAAGNGVNGYGAGGTYYRGGGASGGITPNSGQGAANGYGADPNSNTGASGYCLIKWYE